MVFTDYSKLFEYVQNLFIFYHRRKLADWRDTAGSGSLAWPGPRDSCPVYPSPSQGSWPALTIVMCFFIQYLVPPFTAHVQYPVFYKTVYHAFIVHGSCTRYMVHWQFLLRFYLADVRVSFQIHLTKQTQWMEWFVEGKISPISGSLSFFL